MRFKISRINNQIVEGEGGSAHPDKRLWDFFLVLKYTLLEAITLEFLHDYITHLLSYLNR
jgi:hypothetical protein